MGCLNLISLVALGDVFEDRSITVVQNPVNKGKKATIICTTNKVKVGLQWTKRQVRYSKGAIFFQTCTKHF